MKPGASALLTAGFVAGCAARSALREADSFRVRPMAAADLGELLQLVDERAFSALFSDCNR